MSLILILAAATSFADLAALDRQVALFTGAPVGAEGGATLPLDRRLRLRPCHSPIARLAPVLRESAAIRSSSNVPMRADGGCSCRSGRGASRRPPAR